MEPKPGSGWTLRLPHVESGASNHFLGSLSPEKGLVTLPITIPLVRGFEGTGQNTGTQLSYSAAAESPGHPSKKMEVVSS